MKLCLAIFIAFAFCPSALAQLHNDKAFKEVYPDYFFYVWRGDVPGVQNVLAKNKRFPVDFPHPDGYTALQLATALRKQELVEFLLNKGANPGRKYPVKDRRCVFRDRADFSAPNVDSVDLMQIAILSCQYARDTTFVKFMWDKLYSRNKWYDKDGNTLLHMAVFSEQATDYWSKDHNFLKYVVQTFDINPNTLNIHGQNALNYYLSQPGGCRGQNYEITYCRSVPKLVFAAQKAGINVEQKDNFGKNYRDYLKEFNHTRDLQAIDSEREFLRVVALQRKFLETDMEAMRQRNREAVEAYQRELSKRNESRQSSSRGCREKCDACFGFGSGKERAIRDVCPECNGRGNNGYSKSVIDGYQHRYTWLSPNTCWKCNGTGARILYEVLPCSYCNGTGCLDKN